MADCERMQEQISAWIDGELPEAERLELEAHLRTCETCAATERAFRALSGALKETADVQPPEDLSARIFAQIEYEQRVTDIHEAKKRVSPWKSILAAAACFAVIASIGILTGPERLGQAAPVGITFLSQNNDGTGLVERIAKPGGNPNTESAAVLGSAEADKAAANEATEAVTDGEDAQSDETGGLLTQNAPTGALDDADSAAVFALLDGADDPAEAPEGEPACTANAKNGDGSETTATVWIVGNDLVFTTDGEHFLRAADRAEALTDILNHE
jgi:negative regulator of sigma E activity